MTTEMAVEPLVIFQLPLFLFPIPRPLSPVTCSRILVPLHVAGRGANRNHFRPAIAGLVRDYDSGSGQFALEVFALPLHALLFSLLLDVELCSWPAVSGLEYSGAGTIRVVLS